MKKIALIVLVLLCPSLCWAAPSTVTVVPSGEYVAEIDLNMMILPGTSAFLRKSIEEASSSGARALVVHLNTPGGLLTSAQEMVQDIFKAPIPIVIYVSPGGSTATSAGVFITLAGHVAAMAPGTSMGSAHPVQGDGKDIEGDMRTKAEQMATALVKSIAENRGRNVSWAEKAVKESSSITEKEALAQHVIDVVGTDIRDVLKQMSGKEVKIGNAIVRLEDFSAYPIKTIEMGTQDRIMNVLSNPNVAALLWLGATTGLSLELYNPGAILPGVVGVICLVLALLVSQVIPVNQAGIILLVLGAALIGLEFAVPSGILGIGGLVAIVLGAMYLIDTSVAPGMAVSYELILPVAALLGGFLLYVASVAVKTLRRRASTGLEGLIGEHGRVIEPVAAHGKVLVHGEIWNACAQSGIIQKDLEVEVVAVRDGLVLEVKPK
ncbi:MAG: nodulation protein NfeD [Oligoflexia bacterium]|nr:nodulation protein NfeD [Oligoflexia bacterium]